MFLLDPAEQRALLSAGSAAPVAAPPTAEHHAKPRKQRVKMHHRRIVSRAILGRNVAASLRQIVSGL